MDSYIKPNWTPLEDLHKLFPELFSMDDFMWMGTTNGIEAYKHRLARGLINIDSNGDFWKYTNLQGAGGGGKYGYVRISDIEASSDLYMMHEFQQEAFKKAGVI